MIEFDVDMGYLLEAGELDCVILNDENGEYEPMKFTSELGSGTCENASELNTDGLAGYYFTCSECGLSICASMGIGKIELSGPRSFRWKVDGRYEFERCPRCGKAVKR